MNGQDGVERLYNLLLDEVGRVVAPLGVDKAVKRLQQGMAQTVTEGRMTTQAGSFVAQISPRQLHVHKKWEDSQAPSRSVWRTLYEFLSTEEWHVMEQIFAHLGRLHQQLSWTDLRHILDFYVERGWVERQEGDQYRLRPMMKITCEGLEDRLERLASALPAMMASVDGFMLEKPSSHVKVVSFTGTDADLEQLLKSLGQWLEQYFVGWDAAEGDGFRIVLTSSRLDISEQELEPGLMV